MIRYLEKHIRGFFLLNIYYKSFLLIFSIWSVLHFFGSPGNMPWHWNPYQWNMINFLWLSSLEGAVISIIGIYLFIEQYYFAFPLNVYLTYSSFKILPNAIEEYLQGHTELTSLTGAVLFSICFIISLISTILWLKTLWLKQPWYSKVIEVS